MSYTLPKMPTPMERPTGNRLVSGWVFNEHRDYERVWRVWQDAVTEYTNPRRESGSRLRQKMFATEADAIAALMHAREQMHRCLMEELEREYRKASQPPAEAEREPKALRD